MLYELPTTTRASSAPTEKMGEGRGREWAGRQECNPASSPAFSKGKCGEVGLRQARPEPRQERESTGLGSHTVKPRPTLAQLLTSGSPGAGGSTSLNLCPQ